MRGVSLRGRRLPVVPAAVTSAKARSRGQRLCRRPRDRARRAVPAGRPPAGVLLPAIALLMRAPPAGPGLPVGPQPGGTRYRTGTTTTARHRPAADDLYRQPMSPQPSGVSAVPHGRWASPHCSCPRRHLAAAGPAAARALPGTSSAHRFPGRPSHTSPQCGTRVRAQAPRQALSAPYQPPLPRGRGHCLAEPDPGLTWLASTLPEPATGRICVLTGNRAQPVAGHVVCSQSPVTV